MSDLSMLIDGRAVPATGGATFDAPQPAGRQRGHARAAPPPRATRCAAVEAAPRAFATWSRTGPTERRMQLLKAADALEAKHAAFAAAMAAETGASGLWAGFNVHLAASMLREAASLTTQISGEHDPVRRARLARDGRAPAGGRGGGHRAVERAGDPRACGPSPRRWRAATPWCSRAARTARARTS